MQDHKQMTKKESDQEDFQRDIALMKNLLIILLNILLQVEYLHRYVKNIQRNNSICFYYEFFGPYQMPIRIYLALVIALWVEAIIVFCLQMKYFKKKSVFANSVIGLLFFRIVDTFYLFEDLRWLFLISFVVMLLWLMIRDRIKTGRKNAQNRRIKPVDRIRYLLIAVRFATFIILYVEFVRIDQMYQ